LYIFSGEKFGENSAENFLHKNVGKIVIFRGKSFENLFFKKFHGIFRGKKCTKNRPLETRISEFSPRCHISFKKKVLPQSIVYRKE
jgi:hypothetical protein